MNITNIFFQLKCHITSNRSYLVSKARERIGKFWELEKLAEDEWLKFVEDLLYKDCFNCKPNPDKEVHLSILYAKLLFISGYSKLFNRISLATLPHLSYQMLSSTFYSWMQSKGAYEILRAIPSIQENLSVLYAQPSIMHYRKS